MNEQYVYIGNTSKDGINRYLFTGERLKLISTITNTERCTYLAQNKNNLYAVQETSCGNILAYKKTSEGLTYIGKKSSLGSGPCHIEISNKKKMLFISNYMDGYFTVYKLKEHGEVENIIYNSVNNKKYSHLHCAKVFNNDNNLITVDLGADILNLYEIQEDSLKNIFSLQFPRGIEPRHIAIYNENIFLLTEKSCMLYVLKHIEGKLEILYKTSILPNNHKKQENDTGAGIKVSSDGRYIYTSLRGHNSISVFKYENKKVELVQNILSYGDTPRDLEIDKTQKYLFVANQDSNEIAIFSRNINNGKLDFFNKQKSPLPTCVLSE